MQRRTTNACGRALPLLAVLGLVAALTACIPERFVGFSSPVYAQDENWLCRPGTTATNHCIGAFNDSTIVNANGSTQVVHHAPLDQSWPSAKVDCFYVYPTVNFAAGGGNDLQMAANVTDEVSILHRQVSKFTEACNVFAPLYRQMNFSAYGNPNGTYQASLDLAYRDVHDAFKHYMANFNGGRPIVLIGHSQGSQHLLHLLQDEFDNDAAFRTTQLQSALLLGWNIRVPVAGQDVGGDLKNIPACRTRTQKACVVNYTSYGAANPPTASSGGFGLGNALCTNPVDPALPSNTSGVLRSYIGATAGVGGLPAVTTPWVQLPGAIKATCTTANGFSFLSIASNTAAGDTRQVSGYLTGISGFGLHLSEFDLTEGNLIDLVRSQSA